MLGRVLLRLTLLAAFGGSALAASSDVVREAQGGHYFANEPVPALDKGYLLFLGTSSADLSVYDPHGQLVFNSVVEGPQVISLHLSDAAIDTDGTVVAVAGYAGAPHGHGGALVFPDRSGKRTRFVPTDRYMPAHVCFAPDHSIWTLGWQRDLVANDTEDREDYFLFHRYAPDGKEAGAFVLRSSFPPGLEPGLGWHGEWGIRAARDRVGALVYPGKTGDKPEWIELDLDGKLIGRWKIGPPPHGGMAFTSDGRLYRQTSSDVGRPGEGLLELAVFDRPSSSWKVRESAIVARGDPEHGLLLGADGDNLVFSQQGGLRLIWKPAP